MKFFAIAAGLATAAALGACSPKAQNETAEAANAVGSDVSATTENAVDDVDAATDEALGSAEATLDNAGAKAERGADRAGNAISNSADRAADATGEALTDAGNSLKD
ncbi:MULTISPECIES: hypothetical protein [unclassified Sphingomonas]|uniref:hypothetical protein n=1 Tax=unclassified Sphingomonas TaxID=196159 RepID=UPI001D12C586|nr:MULTISPECIES: hypothetical protein [unclassified Sphingomonas]MCC2979899.1 hypothetical protein [Sphingomonas sp. IC4-52]MCD2314660.1 hypothetical protein [Sphingomonas sp. IC-11]